MNLDPNKYKHCYPVLKSMYARDIDKGIKSNVSSIAIATGAPCLAVAMFLEELYGVTPELTDQINKLTLFYSYEIIYPLVGEKE